VFQGDVVHAPFPHGSFDVITLIDVLEHCTAPKEVLNKIRALLVENGVLFIVTPNIAAWSRRFLNDKWFHLKPEHVCYYSPTSIRKLLTTLGFHLHYIDIGFKYLSYQYILGHFKEYSSGRFTSVLQYLGSLLPRKLYTLPFKIPTEMICIGTKQN
jgi:SAM-dependent methyltransferase